MPHVARRPIRVDNVGVLDDYGSVAEGLLTLYQVTGDDEWLAFAGILLDVAVQHFADGEGGFFDTADDAPALIQRPRDPSDNAEPSGWFAVANACVTYSAITGLPEYRDVAEPRSWRRGRSRAAGAAGGWLGAGSGDGPRCRSARDRGGRPSRESADFWTCGIWP